MADPDPKDGTFPAPADASSGLSAVLRALAADRPDGTDPPVPAAGQKIGRFVVLGELGRGGFGVVLEAKDSLLGRRVALKLLRPRRAAAGPSALEEAEAVARLSHPNVVQLHEAGTDPAGPFLVFELLRGEPLSARLERGPLPPAEAARLGLEVARGLAAAHAAGIVHRDLKPSNVFLCEDGPVKVLDFGLALVAGRREASSGGTPGWMAPEQLRGAPEDERTDVWALGSILARALAGKEPEGSALKLAGPPELGALVLRMRAQDPVKRPRDARAVVAALEPIVLAMEAAPPPGTVTSGSAPAAPARPRLPWRSVLVVLAAALVAGGLLASRALRPAAPPLPPGERPLVVVADFANATQDPDLDGLSGLLITSLEQSRRVSAVTRSRMLDLARQGGRTAVDRIDEALGREVARAAGARVLLSAAVRRFDDLYSVELHALDPSTSASLFSLEERARGKAAIPALVDRLSDRAREALQETAQEVQGSRIDVARAVTGNVAAYARYFRGAALLVRYDMQGALAEFDAAVALDPGFVLPQLGVAYMAEFQNVGAERERAALAAIARAIDRLPRKERLLALAMTAVREGRVDEAKRRYAEAAEAFPDDEVVLYLAGDYFHHEGDPVGALGFLERQLALDPGAASAGHAIEDLAMLGRTDEALEVARRAAAANAANAGLVPYAYVLRGERDRALALAREAAATGRTEDLLTLADALLVTNDLAGAEGICHRILDTREFSPAYRAEAFHTLAKVSMLRGRMTEAVTRSLRADSEPGITDSKRIHTRHYAVTVALARRAGSSGPARSWTGSRPRGRRCSSSRSWRSSRGSTPSRDGSNDA